MGSGMETVVYPMFAFPATHLVSEPLSTAFPVPLLSFTFHPQQFKGLGALPNGRGPERKPWTPRATLTQKTGQEVRPLPTLWIERLS